MDLYFWRSPTTIRSRCGLVGQQGLEGVCAEWILDLDQMPTVVQAVLRVMERDYPHGEIPFHSRWRHLPNVALETGDPREDLRLKLEGVLVSVLLDAGAGSQWRWRDPQGRVWQRSEGLARASWHAFVTGAFVGEGHSLGVDSQGLAALTAEKVGALFQISQENLLVGLPGRLALLHRLGEVVADSPFFPGSRVGGIADYLLGEVENNCLSAVQVFHTILTSLAPIWPDRITVAGENLGDVWFYPGLQHIGDPGWIPFHKLSQWLTYSFLEPFQEYGIVITDLDHLTGLAEYRNGGLFVDYGVLVPRDPQVLSQPQSVGSPVVVAWRALTVFLLDRLAEMIREQLQTTESELPLVKILQGGTWTAGREIAAQKRAGGIPPLTILSDGTVF